MYSFLCEFFEVDVLPDIVLYGFGSVFLLLIIIVVFKIILLALSFFSR